MIRIAGVVVAAAALSGCVVPIATRTETTEVVAVEAEEIRYETSPCYGTCPVYVATLRPDGTGRFEGQRFTKVEGARDFTFPRADYVRFAAALAPYRPVGERRLAWGEPGCGQAATDMPSVDVRWSEASGASHHLNVYYGCSDVAPAMKQALREAPALVPALQALVGTR